MLGIGANSLRGEEAITAARTILRMSDLITLRDEGSRRVCLDLGADDSRAVLTADPAFILTGKETVRSRGVKTRLQLKGRAFGVNMVNEVWAQRKEYKAAVAKMCDHFATRHGLLPVFFANEIRSGVFFDTAANQETARLMECPAEILDPVYYSPEEMIDILSSFEFVLGMRMHVLIFSALAKTPFTAVSRIDKVSNCMSLFGLCCPGAVNECNVGRLISECETLLRNRYACGRRIAEGCRLLRCRAWKNLGTVAYLLGEVRETWRNVDAESGKYVLPRYVWLDSVGRFLGKMAKCRRRAKRFEA